MATEDKEMGDNLSEQLDILEAQGRIPYDINEVFQQVRWQWEKYPSGVHYSAPTDPLQMGRYNDPTGRTGICYTADIATTAVAESLGRIYQRSPEGFILGLSDLEKAHLYTLETTRITKTINMLDLQSILHIPADETMGVGQSITQAVTNWAANTPGLDYDGIRYYSRHYLPGMCTAFWVRDGMSDPLTDIANSSVDSYVDSNPKNFPQGWEEDDITGFEIVTEKLRFDVSTDD